MWGAKIEEMDIADLQRLFESKRSIPSSQILNI